MSRLFSTCCFIFSLAHFHLFSQEIDRSKLAQIDDIVTKSIKNDDISGAVVLVGSKDHILYHKAFGFQAVQPTKVPMRRSTIFDIASLTKVVATTPAILLLAEQGKVDIHAPLAQYIPEFRRNGKNTITIKQIMLHTAGLIADNPESDYLNGRDTAFQSIYDLGLINTPGSTWLYSDVGYIMLAELVRQISGNSLDQFAQEYIFKPLHMHDTMFVPPQKYIRRIAPTEKSGAEWICGRVHDPRAHALGGFSGHAGIFSTAQDLANYCQMLLNKGTYKKRCVLSAPLIDQMTTPHELNNGVIRSLGWDMTSPHSSPKGEFSEVSFGHTGFTGTSLWIDPKADIFVIILSSRLHPKGRKGNVMEVRKEVSKVVSQAVKWNLKN